MDKSTGEPLLINGAKVEQSVTFKPSTDCGEVEMFFPLNSSDLAGKELVVFESLYYKDDLKAEHADLTDTKQTIDVIQLKTTATDANTGEKVLPVDVNAVLKDEVQYCLKPGLEYTLKGVIANRETGDVLLIDGKPIEQTVTFTPEDAACGSLEMLFNLNTSGLGGAKLVVFESLYVDDQLILEHHDVNDEGESFEIELPVPETGLNTKHNDGARSMFEIGIPIFTIAIIAPIGFYIIKRYNAKKNFFKR